MVGVETLLTPSKERNHENRKGDDAWYTGNGEKPRESDREPRVPMDDAILVKHELRIVIPCDVHHQRRSNYADEADEGEGQPTEMDSMRAYHLDFMAVREVCTREHGVERVGVFAVHIFAGYSPF
jgi:hypothetical protein